MGVQHGSASSADLSKLISHYCSWMTESVVELISSSDIHISLFISSVCGLSVLLFFFLLSTIVIWFLTAIDETSQHRFLLIAGFLSSLEIESSQSRLKWSNFIYLLSFQINKKRALIHLFFNFFISLWSILSALFSLNHWSCLTKYKYEHPIFLSEWQTPRCLSFR